MMKKNYLILAFLFSAMMFGQTSVFTAVSGNNWSTVGNWSQGLPSVSAQLNVNATLDVDASLTGSLICAATTTARTLTTPASPNNKKITIAVSSATLSAGVSNIADSFTYDAAIEFNNGGTATFVKSLSITSGVNPRTLTFGPNSVLTLNSLMRIVAPSTTKVVFQGKIEGSLNLQFQGASEFGANADNTGYNGDFVYFGANAAITSNTTVAGGFLKATRKVQVNNTGCSLTLNGANSCNGNLALSTASGFTLNINANQGSFGTITIGDQPLTIAVNSSVTNLSFANSAAAVWGAGTVNITGYQPGEIRFGTTSTALTTGQLLKITADGVAAGNQPLALDANGFLVLASSIATTWTGTTSIVWTDASNWSNGVPTSTSNVTIAVGTNQPTIGANVNINTLAIVSGATLSVTANTLTVTGAITNNGTMTVANNANLIQAGTTNTNTGAITVNRNSSPLLLLDFTLWSSPVAGQSLTAFSPLTSQNPSRFYTFDTTFGTSGRFNEIALPSLASTNFAAGAGYLIRMPNTASASTPTAYAGAFTGIPNNGDIPVTLLNGGAAGLRYNLVGNPYPSPISITTFVADNSANIENSLYFWRKTNAAAGSAYCTYNTVGAIFTSNGNAQVVDPLGVIQTGQGFFVEAKPGITSLTFRNGQRVANTAGQFFRTTNQAVAPSRIWLNATTTGAFFQMAINYAEGATLAVDDYDSKYINDSPFALTSKINNEEFTIQGRPTFNVSDAVALNFKTNTAGNYTIAIDHTEGVFANGQNIYLVDSITGTETNLQNGAYNFTATAGVDNTRFYLKYQTILNINPATLNENNVQVFKKSGALHINSSAIAISTIQVYDIQGRLLAEQKNVKSNTASINNLRAENQVLIVRVTGEDNSIVNKKVAN